MHEKSLSNERAQAEIRKAQLALHIVETKDEMMAKLFAQLNPPPASQLVPYVLASPKDGANG